MQSWAVDVVEVRISSDVLLDRSPRLKRSAGLLKVWVEEIGEVSVRGVEGKLTGRSARGSHFDEL